MILRSKEKKSFFPEGCFILFFNKLADGNGRYDGQTVVAWHLLDGKPACKAPQPTRQVVEHGLRELHPGDLGKDGGGVPGVDSTVMGLGLAVPEKVPNGRRVVDAVVGIAKSQNVNLVHTVFNRCYSRIFLEWGEG